MEYWNYWTYTYLAIGIICLTQGFKSRIKLISSISLLLIVCMHSLRLEELSLTVGGLTVNLSADFVYAIYALGEVAIYSLPILVACRQVKDKKELKIGDMGAVVAATIFIIWEAIYMISYLHSLGLNTPFLDGFISSIAFIIILFSDNGESSGLHKLLSNVRNRVVGVFNRIKGNLDIIQPRKVV